ncbi:MAG: LysR family transcriptional regulator [Methylobacteriaceae bacterium]|nr:LysR family transcriptional regulator [Methylobacteriaceae bacterium]
MNIRFLETFYWLAKLRNFSAVAERLNTTQPAVSARLRALERELGAQLCRRTTREVRLTPAGLGVLRHAEVIVEEARRIRERVGRDDEPAGIVRLGVVDAIVRTWLPDLFAWIAARYPRIALEVTVDTTLQLARGLREGELHCVVAIEPIAGEHLASAPLCRYAMGFVCRPDMAPRGRSAATPADVARLPLIVYPPQSPPARLVADYFARAGVAWQASSVSNSMSTMIELAADGIGVAMVPPVCVARDVEAGRLVVIPLDPPFEPIGFAATWLAAPRDAAIAGVVEGARAVAATYKGSL